MLYVDIPTHSELVALAIERTPASVSIYLPTTPVSGEISGDRTVLKNLAKEAVAQLVEAGHDKREAGAIEAHLDDLVDDDGFWRFQAHSLAIFATPAGVRTFRVPNVLAPMAEVADRFHLKPLPGRTVAGQRPTSHTRREPLPTAPSPRCWSISMPRCPELSTK